MGLAEKTVKNTAIVFLAEAFSRLARLGTKIILARLLLPQDFGLIAVAAICIETLNLFRDLGVGPALVYRQERVEEAANTAFVLIIIFSAVLAVISYTAAPYISDYFNEPQVSLIVRVFTITFIISSLQVLPMTLLEKGLEFKKAVTPTVVSTIAYSIVAVYMAYNGYGVWSLVYGGLIASVFGLFTVWHLSPMRPSPNLNPKIARELLGYGKHVLAATLIAFAAANLDDLVVGKALGMTALGFYALAYNISNWPANQVSQGINRVMFPTFSKLQDDAVRLRRAYLKTLSYVGLVSFPLSFGLLVISPIFVPVVLTEKWLPIVPLIQVMCFYGLSRAFGKTAGTLFQAKGKPQFVTYYSSIILVFLLSMMPFVSRLGLIGVSLMVTSGFIYSSILAFRRANEILGVSGRDIMVNNGGQLLSSVVAAAATYALIHTLIPINLFGLLSALFVYSFLYVGTILSVSRGIVSDMQELVTLIR